MTAEKLLLLLRRWCVLRLWGLRWPLLFPGRGFCSSGLRVQGCKPLVGVWGQRPQFNALGCAVGTHFT